MASCRVYTSSLSQRPLSSLGTTRLAPSLCLGEKKIEFISFPRGKSWRFVDSRRSTRACDPQLNVTVSQRFLFLWKNRKFCILHYKKNPCTQTKCTESIQGGGGVGRRGINTAMLVSYELTRWCTRWCEETGRMLWLRQCWTHQLPSYLP